MRITRNVVVLATMNAEVSDRAECGSTFIRLGIWSTVMLQACLLEYNNQPGLTRSAESCSAAPSIPSGAMLFDSEGAEDAATLWPPMVTGRLGRHHFAPGAV